MFEEKVREICLKNGVDLLHLIKFGSHLYGLNTPESDEDLKGIFLPRREDLLLCKNKRSINTSTGDVNSKNTSEDVDIELWSLQYFLELVKKGDTGGLDLLFSPSNPDSEIFRATALDEIFNSPLRLFDPKNINAYIGYAIGQAKKYGVKGSRLGAIKKVVEWCDKNINLSLHATTKLSAFLKRIEADCGDASYCFIKEIPVKLNGDSKLVRTLFLCGKQHQETITIGEFYGRISSSYNEYGERARLAEKNEGIDWKAISHAVRAILQTKQILTTGCIKFPFVGEEKELLLNLKQGNFSWKKAEELIVSGLAEVDDLLLKSTIVGDHDNNFIRQEVLKLYETGNRYSI